MKNDEATLNREDGVDVFYQIRTPEGPPRQDTPTTDDEQPLSGRVSRTEGEDEFRLWQETVRVGQAGELEHRHAHHL